LVLLRRQGERAAAGSQAHGAEGSGFQRLTSGNRLI
jgi:hypothetical protein